MDLLRLAVVAVVLCVAGAASAQLASPGPLSAPHAKLEGMGNCTKCHPAGKQLSADACLACHVELKRRIGAQRGLHGRMTIAERGTCNGCHRDHEGRDFHIVDWRPSKERFDHAKTGWPLKGKHGGQKCAACHEPHRIVDADAQALLRRGADTYLGLTPRCVSCHFDEHRGQVPEACDTCHTEESWKLLGKFDHGLTDYPLHGKHRAVACKACHPTVTDEAPRPPFPPMRSSSYAKYAGIEHERCTDCHDDPHDGRFGLRCEGCHSVEGWSVIKHTKDDRAFHDKTRFPLRGLHAGVACTSCHGGGPGKPGRFKGLQFGKCRDCHADAHSGQLRDPTCERCHTVNGFRPSKFELEDHARTSYPLLGAHAAVACSACHPSRARAAEATSSRPVHERRGGRGKAPVRAGGAVRLASIVLRLGNKGERCENCHLDAHAGQMRDVKDGCVHCHEVDSFRRQRFDHDESRFRLSGAHQKAPCAACHRLEQIGGVETVRYRPLDPACAACHADVHLGQFKDATCDRCHTTTSFKKTRFSHNDRRFTSFPLEGKHGKVGCASCHKSVAYAPAKSVVRYRPLPQDCDRCHADFHKGDFKGMTAAALGASAPSALPRPPGQGARNDGRTRCDLCHRVQGWDDVRFPHEQTGFPLNGQHRQVTCKSCHPASFKQRVPERCAGCHRDAHAGEFGQRCEGCHQEESWRTTFSADAHRATNFPLSGRHALIPCTECHPNVRDRSFARTAIPCVSCHQADVDRAAMTSIDHGRAGFTNECRGCHTSFAWRPARYPSHDRCFPISAGSHAGIRCRACHSAVPPPETLSACTSNTAACTSCHAHDRNKTDAIHLNRGVAGYDYRDRKCYECHPGG